MAKEFRENSSSMNLDELDNAFKCLSLAYIGMTEDMWQHSAFILLQMETKTYLLCELKLLQPNKGTSTR